MKRWFNRHWPYYRRCMKPWCWRGEAYQYRCHVHAHETLRG